MTRPALVPELYVSDLVASLEFYVDLLGFRIEYERREERFAALSLGRAHLMLEQVPGLEGATPEEFRGGKWLSADLAKPFGRGVNLEIEVSDIQSFDSRIAERGYPLLLELHEKAYRVGSEDRVVKQLLIADPDGYLVRLSQLATGRS